MQHVACSSSVLACRVTGGGAGAATTAEWKAPPHSGVEGAATRWNGRCHPAAEGKPPPRSGVKGASNTLSIATHPSPSNVRQRPTSTP
eukprot:366453-Chlamydomonas_euryale.AAC.7